MSNSDFEDVRSRSPVPLEDCGMAAAAEIVGDNWTLLILREAFYSVVRYDDMRADLGISRSVLSDRLSKLVARGVLEKQPYREEGDRERMAYILTQRGREFGVVLLAMLEWGNRTLEGGPRYIIAEKGTANPARLGLIDRTGKEISPLEAEVVSADSVTPS